MRFYYSPASRKTNGLGIGSDYVFINKQISKMNTTNLKHELTQSQIYKIKELYPTGKTIKQILTEMGLTNVYYYTLTLITRNNVDENNKTSNDITDNDVLKIRELYEINCLTLNEIHRQYSFVSMNFIRNIVRYTTKKYQHIKVDNPKRTVYKHFDYKPKTT